MWQALASFDAKQLTVNKRDMHGSIFLASCLAKDGHKNAENFLSA
jgi:hypothetical protein